MDDVKTDMDITMSILIEIETIINDIINKNDYNVIENAILIIKPYEQPLPSAPSSQPPPPPPLKVPLAKVPSTPHTHQPTQVLLTPYESPLFYVPSLSIMSEYIILEYIQINVFKVMNKKTGKKSIIKKYNKNSDKIDRIMMEKEIYEKVKHPLICTCEKILDDDSYYYFILDYYEKSLFDIINVNNNENIIRFYSAELICVLEHLHINGYIHKDIKPENIMIDNDGHIKLVDFDLSSKTNISMTISPKVPLVTYGCCLPIHTHNNIPNIEIKENMIYDDDINHTNRLCGTIEYIAPEIINNEKYNSSIDLWMIGILLYELKYNKTPFIPVTQVPSVPSVKAYQSINMDIILDNICNNELVFPDNNCDISNELKDLITKLLIKNPRERISMTEIKNHSFYKNINFQLIMTYMPPI
jgi:protein-serine/threonine kinase